jgi:hypothetical protein
MQSGETAWVNPASGGEFYGSGPNCNNWSETGVDVLTYRANQFDLMPQEGSVSGRMRGGATLRLDGSCNGGQPISFLDFVSFEIEGLFWDAELQIEIPVSVKIPGDFELISIAGQLSFGATPQSLEIRFGNGELLFAGPENPADLGIPEPTPE